MAARSLRSLAVCLGPRPFVLQVAILVAMTVAAAGSHGGTAALRSMPGSAAAAAGILHRANDSDEVAVDGSPAARLQGNNPFTAGVPPACLPYVNMPNGDLAGMPLPMASAHLCEEACLAHTGCVVYTFVGAKSPKATRCAGSGGCCWLKAAEVGGHAPVVWDAYACSAFVRVPPAPTVADGAAAATVGKRSQRLAHQATPAPSASPFARQGVNVLYIVIDDLRPDLVSATKIVHLLVFHQVVKFPASPPTLILRRSCFAGFF